MDNEIKILMASEARKITEDSNFLRKSVYRWIKEACARNCDNIILCKCDYDSAVFDALVCELKGNGYKVIEDVEGDCYYVKW